MQKSAIITILIFFITVIPDYTFSQGIGNLTAPNKHNLSVTGQGPIKARTETQICVFCHTPHHALSSGPLWNHTMSSATYTVSLPPGASGTQLSTPENPPDGDSKLCLSCHDGTVSLGDVQNIGASSTVISMKGSMPAAGPGSTNLGTDLSGNHLVSIELNSELNTEKNSQCGDSVSYGVKGPGSIVGPALLKNTNNCYPQPTCVKSPKNKGVQCTSCHDPHYDPIPGTTKFLRGTAGADPSTWVENICLSCHCNCSVSGSCPP